MAGKKPVALFIGRFQPFHKGHLSALKWILERNAGAIVAIGSAQKSFEPENPFTAEERKRMIKRQLETAGIAKKCRIVSVTDVGDNGRWVAHMDRKVPRYDVVYSNNPLVKRLMREAGKDVMAVPFFSKEKFNATKIRGRMKKGEKWGDRVPEKIRQQLRKMGAEERVRKL